MPSTKLLIAFFATTADPVVEELAALDLDGLTPREALGRLAGLQDKARGRRP